MQKVSTTIILAAGKGTRLEPLTLTTPKPLLRIANQTLLAHNIEQLKELTERVVVIVPKGDTAIREELALQQAKHEKLALHSVEQEEPLGSAHAVKSAKAFITGRTLVLMGDDLYSRKDLQKLVTHENGILGKHVKDLEKFGALIHENNILKEIKEKQTEVKEGLSNIGAYLFNEAMIPILEQLSKSERGELEFTDAMNIYSKQQEVQIEEVQEYWFPIGYPWHMLEANEFFVSKLKESKIEGTIEENVVIKGNIILGKGSVIKAGSYIEGNAVIGENCEIGPHAYLRKNVTIGNSCKVGLSVEVKNSILFEGAKVPHLSYVGDSIIGKQCNIGGGTMIANLRFDDGNIKTVIKDQKIDSGRRKLGCVLGANVKTGANATLLPGVKVWPGLCVMPGEVVKEDKHE